MSWRIAAKSDCLRLTEILARYPLRGRKSHDYAIWRAAVQFWIDGDPSARRAGRDWTPLAHLKHQLARVRRFGVATAPLIDDRPGLDGDWGGFLAGFLTAEGHLSLAEGARGRIRPRADVHVRADDRELLEQLSARTGVGAVYGPYRSSSASPSIMWSVVGLADLVELVRILDKNPPRGRKQLEFRLWREAVAARRRPRPATESALARLRAEPADVRAYSVS